MKAIEFYSGVGGFSLGMKRAGFNVNAAFEIDWRHVETYNKNFGDGKAICQDVSKLGFNEEDFGLDLDGLDLVFGGPPCQGFSNGGKQNVSDIRNDQILRFAELVTELGPRGFVMENVSGILNKKFKNKLDLFFEQMKRGGYTVYNPIMLNAKEFSVPQDRKRVFFIGVKSNSKVQQPHLEEILNQHKSKARITVNDAIQDILHINLDPNSSDVYSGSYGEGTAYSKTLRKPKNEKKKVRLTGCMTTAHSNEVIERFESTDPGSVEPISRYKRLSLSGVSNTLRAGTIRGRGQFMAPRPIHPVYNRCITTREAARLHSYPDWFEFYPTKWYGMMQIGNSVPPNLSESIGKTLREILN